MLLAALCAEGESTIDNVGQIERGYERIDERLRALGAKIERVEDRRAVVSDHRRVAEIVADFAAFGIRAFTTTRASRAASASAVRRAGAAGHGAVASLRDELAPGGARLATATQVHGARVRRRTARAGRAGSAVDDADGHVAADRGTALAVTVADCVPVFIAHPSGAIALLHSGWRGTAARIVERGHRARSPQRGFRRGGAARPPRAGDLRQLLRGERRRATRS